MRQRATIHLEDAAILEHRSFPGAQYVFRVRAPRAAGAAIPGSFAHIRCDESVPMRRPLSIMRTDPDEGWLEFLYRPVGSGLAKLTRRALGDTVSVLAPIGNGFSLDAARPDVLAIGGGVGIPPMIFLAQTLKGSSGFRPLVLMGSEVPFPFDLVPAKVLPEPAAGATHGLRLLEDWAIGSALASNADLMGTYRGHVPDLAREYLKRKDREAMAATQIVACGPEPMLEATAKLAEEFGLPCQIALEEYMACGVGGCAGCTVRVQGPDGPAMRRVCVDGPVFRASEIYPLSRS